MLTLGEANNRRNEDCVRVWKIMETERRRAFGLTDERGGRLSADRDEQP